MGVVRMVHVVVVSHVVTFAGAEKRRFPKGWREMDEFQTKVSRGRNGSPIHACHNGAYPCHGPCHPTNVRHVLP